MFENSLNSPPWSKFDAWFSIVVNVVIDVLGHPGKQRVWKISTRRDFFNISYIKIYFDIIIYTIEHNQSLVFAIFLS